MHCHGNRVAMLLVGLAMLLRSRIRGHRPVGENGAVPPDRPIADPLTATARFEASSPGDR